MKDNHIANIKTHLKGLAKKNSYSSKDKEIYIDVKLEHITKVLSILKEKSGYHMFIDLFASDYLQREKRFEVTYCLLNMVENIRCVIRVCVAESEHVPTSLHIFSAATWYEREVWDMYGIIFKDNDDLRRILTDYGFEGHPQRKDFPVTGYVEVTYDKSIERVKYEPVKLDQAFRDFDFSSPWEGNINTNKKRG